MSSSKRMADSNLKIASEKSEKEMQRITMYEPTKCTILAQ
jgi:hypothetical protein